MTDTEVRTTLKLSIQRALLDEVTPRLCSVTCGLDGGLIEIRAYFSGRVTEEDVERIQIVGAEVIADFPEGFRIKDVCLSTEDEEERMLDFWAFRAAKGVV